MKRLALLICATATVTYAQAAPVDVHVHVAPNATASFNSTDNFPTIQMAMDHAPQPGPGGRLFVHIADGTYSERVMVTANRPRTTLLGNSAHPEKVVIVAGQNAKSAGGTFFSQTVDIEAPAFAADGITFANNAGATGQAVAIAVRSDRALFKHCRFLGLQDTLFADYGRQYYVDSYIAGGVDFIFGNAAAVFDRDEIHALAPGYLTAQSRTAPQQPTGFVITHAFVTAEPFAGTLFLGRPWRPYARVVVLQTQLPAQLSPQGWSPWRKNDNPANVFYAEFGNTGPGAATAGRAGFAQQLTAQQAAAFAPQTFLNTGHASSDTWDPLAEAARLP